eukprot:gene9076-11116_t
MIQARGGGPHVFNIEQQHRFSFPAVTISFSSSRPSTHLGPPNTTTMNQIGSARFKSHPDLHNIDNSNDPSQIWRTNQGSQLSDSLWKNFKSNIGSLDLCNEYLKKFVLHYNSQYDKWNKELQPDSLEMRIIAVKIKSTPILDLISTQFIVHQLCSFVLCLSKALTDDTLAIPDGLHYIYLINILSRAPQNIQILLQENALAHPFQAARLAAYKLSSFKDETNPSFIKWWPYLKVLLANCCQIASNFIEELILWTTECFQPPDSHQLSDECCENSEILGSLSTYNLGISTTTYDSLQQVLNSLKYTTFSEKSTSPVKQPVFPKRSKIPQLAQLFQVLHLLTFTTISLDKISISSQGSSGSLFFHQQSSNSSSSIIFSSSSTTSPDLIDQQGGGEILNQSTNAITSSSSSSTSPNNSSLNLGARQLIINEELSIHAIQDTDLIETLFLLLRKPDMKQYAITQIFLLMKLNPESDEALSEMYNIYISQLSKIREETSHDYGFDLTLALLDGIRQIVKNNPRKQMLFKKFGVALKIVNLINIDEPKSRLAVLCHSVLRTLIVLMVNNAKIKKNIRKHIGYDTIRGVILKAEEPLSETTMNILFDMIVDDEFDKEYKYIIQNSDAALLLFDLLRYFPAILQRKILDTFTPIVQKVTTNQSVCCNCHLIYHLIEAIHKDQPMDITARIFQLIQELGYHSVTVRELKRLFGLLKSEPGDFRPRTTSVLLETLQNISVSRNPGPQVYFDFDGKDSSIILPTFDKWPFSKGFSFCTWVRIESFIDPTGTPDYKPRLFSFLSDTGCGVEALFIYQQFQILTVSQSIAKPVFTNSPTLEERKWYFVCVVYSTNLISSNEIRVYIDGQQRAKAPIKLTIQGNLMNGFRIGNNTKMSGDRSSPLYGQMGAFNIFDETLSQGQIQAIYTLGPNFNTSFQDVEGITKYSHTFDSSLTSHLFLNYNCRALEGDLCLDNTPDIGGDRNFDATLVSINPCVSRDIKDIIYCLGGIQVLFPLIPQINQSVLGDPDDQSSAKLTIQVLALFKDMLRGSEANQEEMLRCQGLSVIGHLLQQISPENLTLGALNIFRDMSNQITEPSLVEEVYLHLLLDFRLWIKTRYEVQKSLLVMIKQIIYEKYDQVREIITVQRIIDIMSDFYWYEVHEKENGSNIFLTQRRPSISDITDLRSMLFDILRLLLRNCTPPDVQAIARFLVYSLDPLQLIEMHEFILDLLSNANGSFQAFFDELLVIGGTDIFLTLLRNVDEKVRVSALQLISKIHLLCNGSSSSNYQVKSTPSLSSTKKKTPKIFQDSIIIARSLHTFPLTEETYRYLLAFTLGFNFTPSSFNKIPSLDDLTLDGCVEIKNPEILGVILKLLLGAESIVLRQQVLQEIKLLITVNSNNRSSCLQIEKWPDHLFSIINDTEIKNDTQYSNVTDLIIDIMKILSIHSFYESKPGYKTLEQILATLRPYNERGVLNYYTLTKTLLLNIISSIKSEAHTIISENVSPLLKKSKKSLVLFDNLVHFLILTEEFIYYSPKDSLHSSFTLLDCSDSTPPQQQQQHLQVPTTTTMTNTSTLSTSSSPSSPLMHFTSIQIHANSGSSPSNPSSLSKLHRGENNDWEDLLLVRELLELADTLKIQNYSSESFSTSTMQPVGKTSFMFSTHHQRIILRLSLEAIKEASKHSDSLNIIMTHMMRIKSLLEKDLNSKSDDSNSRCIFTLCHLIKALKNTTDHNLSSHQKILVPYMKDLIRKLKSLLVDHLVQRQVASSGSPHTNSTREIESNVSAWIADLADTSRIVDFCSIIVSTTGSVRWINVVDFIDTNAVNLFANEEKLVVSTVEKRKKKSNKNVQNLEDKEAESFTMAERKADSDLKAIQTNLWNPECERRSIIIQNYRQSTSSTTAQWRRILRSLTNERGPWGTTESVVHWKLDKTENSSRMRHKLKRNYKFDEHLNCAISDETQQNNNNNNNNTTSDSRDNSISDTDEIIKIPTIATAGDKKGHEDAEDDWTMVFENLNEDLSSSMNLAQQQQQQQQQSQQKERLIYSSSCELITPLSSRKGKLDITSVKLMFTEDTPSDVGDLVNFTPKIKIWPNEMIKEIHLRRYLLRGSALEIFMKDKTNYFFNFSKNDRNKVYSKINSARRVFFREGTMSPAETLKKATLDWQQRKICNFDYLMTLNTIAGRTFNDLTQYPVFPWVIADYTSEKLDLTKKETFRDLSKPIGALDEKRLELFKERYDSFDDPVIPKFFYGSHYSSSGIVLYYLIRMEPFTSLFLQLQGGRFDHADRMFDSIQMAWENSLHSTTDVKELIPEFYYMPEFLINHNGFNFGIKQNGVPISDVKLPPWAPTAQDFVRINREALESEYVSANLHKWIELIFGIKQRGLYAIEAHNVFYYLTYEGSVDIDSIEDENTRRATESQINNFGQTPTQLFSKKPHPLRDTINENQISILKTPNNQVLRAYILQISTKSPLVFIFIPEPNLTMSYLMSDKVIVIDKSRTPTCHKWFPNTPNEKMSPFTFEQDPSSTTKRRIGLPFANDVTISPNCFAITSDGRYLISCGHWDNSFKLSYVDSAKLIQSVVKHKDTVTCFALGADDQTLITGSKDTTVMVWNLSTHKSGTPKFDDVPVHILYGHDDEITCVDISVDLDISLSGSKDGTCIIHSLKNGQYVRSIYLPKQSPVSLIAISSQGYIVIYSQADLIIYLYTINGQLLTSVDAHERLNSMILTKDSEFLITGGERGLVTIRTLYDLKPTTHKLQFSKPIHSLAMASDQKHLMVGLEDDTAGQEEYIHLRDSYSKNGNGFLLIYSIDNRGSFNEIKNIRETICKAKGSLNFPMILIGNKCDLLEKDREISTLEGQNLAKSWNVPFFETSAKQPCNIIEAFTSLVKDFKKSKIGNNRKEFPKKQNYSISNRNRKLISY